MREHEKNAMAVARHLESSPHVEKVFYPDMCLYVLYLLLCVCGMCVHTCACAYACVHSHLAVYVCVFMVYSEHICMYIVLYCIRS